MSEPIQCFLLGVEDRKTKQWGVMSKAWVTERCPKKDYHVVVKEVGLDKNLGELNGMFLPALCECGFELTVHNSSTWTGEHEHWYTNPKTGKQGQTPSMVASPGAMWFCPWLVEDETGTRKFSSFLSPEYLRDWFGKRPPICVRLPNGSDWIVDQKADNSTTGWTVTGEPPLLTCSPSIDAKTYHSFLINGVLGADPNCVVQE